MKLRALISIALLALILSACGGNSDSPQSAEESKNKAAEVKPCDLVTQEEAEAAYGGSLNPGEAQNNVVSTCVFTSTRTETARFADMVQIQVQPVYVFDGTKRADADGTTLENAVEIESVSGVGEEAFYQINTGNDISSAGITLLGFKKNGVAIYVSVSNLDFDLEKVKTAEKQLAEKAASRL